MRLASVLSLALAAAGRLAAQATGVVVGTVSDTSGRPLQNARVHVVQTALSTLSDAAGRFRLAAVPPGPATVQAQLIGFYPAQSDVLVAAGDSVAASLVLQAGAMELNPVIVSAAKRSQLLDQAMTSVSLVSREAIAMRAVNTVDEAVDKAPGVQFINGQVNIRGSSGFVEGLGSRVLLLVDGVPANQGDRGGINWDLVPVDQVQRVEVVKGAGSALYGSSAFGGVVNLITRELPSGPHARLRATAGLFADPPNAVWGFRDYTGIQDGLDVSASYGRERVRAGFAAGARHSDGYREQDKADHWQVTGRGEWRPEPAMLVRLSGAWASDQYQVPEPWCASGQCADSGQGFQPFRIDTANSGNTTRSDKGYFTAIVTRTPSASIAWSTRLSWLRTHFTDVYPGRQPPFAPADFAVANRYGGEARLVSRHDTGQVVTVGVEAAHSDVASNVFSGDTTGGGGSHMQDEYAAYAEAEQVMGPLRATLGARGDFLAIDGSGVTAFVSPRGGVVWPTRTGSWRASLGRAYRAPSLAERFVTTYALGFRVIPNPALRAEDGWTAEVGRAWTPRSWLRGDAAIFFTEARHLVEPATTPSLQIQFQNVQRARLVGLDCNLTVMSFGPHLTATIAYLYLDARELAHDTVPERPLLYRARHLVTLTADYTWRSVGVGADLRSSSRFERQDPLFPGDPRLGGRVLDLRASWTVGALEAHLKVANALNYIYNLAPRVLEPVRTTTLTLAYTY
ncbi:MAG TPA: TonB-dependent receptor [Gemmatimonadales bacterium]|nr:TonB-dependent receptor [Gemmatimonadales bacterium]